MLDMLTEESILLADKAYDTDAIRKKAADVGAFANIPILGGVGSALTSFFGFFTDADSKFAQIGRIGKLSDADVQRLNQAVLLFLGLAGR